MPRGMPSIPFLCDRGPPDDQEMRSAILKELKIAKDSQRVIGVWRKRLDKHVIRGVVLASTSDLALLHLLDDGIRLDGYSVIRTRDITRLDLLLPRAEFYYEALRLRKQCPRNPRGIDLSDLTTVITSAGKAYPLVTVHPERKQPGICWIGRPLHIEKRDLVLAYITPGAMWEGDQRCCLADIPRSTSAELMRSRSRSWRNLVSGPQAGAWRQALSHEPSRGLAETGPIMVECGES